MDAAGRLFQFIDFKGFGEGRKGKSLRIFYNDLELSQGTLRVGRSIGTEILNKIFSKYPELNMDWVVTGRGEMLYSEKPTMIVGADGEAASIAVDTLKQENKDLLKELNAVKTDLIKCLQQKEKLVDGYKEITLNEPKAKKEKAE